MRDMKDWDEAPYLVGTTTIEGKSYPPKIRPLPGTETTHRVPNGWEWWSWDAFGIGLFIGMGIGALLGVITYG